MNGETRMNLGVKRDDAEKWFRWRRRSRFRQLSIKYTGMKGFVTRCVGNRAILNFRRSLYQWAASGRFGSIGNHWCTDWLWNHGTTLTQTPATRGGGEATVSTRLVRSQSFERTMSRYYRAYYPRVINVNGITTLLWPSFCGRACPSASNTHNSRL
jgi:hypothetical protein